MIKTLLKIITGITVLLVFVFIGIPFEMESPITESVFRIISFLLIFTLLFFLFRQAGQLKNFVLRRVNYIALSLLSFLFLIGAMWNDVLVLNTHGNWYNLEICTNEAGVKILKQMRETSGSMWDYRDRLVIYEFDESNRISINMNMKYFSGPWTVVKLESTRFN